MCAIVWKCSWEIIYAVALSPCRSVLIYHWQICVFFTVGLQRTIFYTIHAPLSNAKVGNVSDVFTHALHCLSTIAVPVEDEGEHSTQWRFIIDVSCDKNMEQHHFTPRVYSMWIQRETQRTVLCSTLTSTHFTTPPHPATPPIKSSKSSPQD